MRNSYSRETPRSNATADTQFAASLTVRSVTDNAPTCSACGINFTCTTIFTLTIVSTYVTTLGAKPSYS
ncbi:hypothetical protein ACFRU3_18940 [Streptomyces sp. NPDC056910]|uniref:hypothetical protein n=1 Tax=Streptomyces sp. NPDC056910 TaxID=3345964 RepID=UPI003682E858